jgi:hypothetical protein
VEHIRVNRAGLTLAVVLAGLHLIWVALVAVGTAQPLLDFAFRIHMMEADATVGEFAFGPAALLLMVTAGVGYVSGAALAAVWNLLGYARAFFAKQHPLPGMGKPAGMS